MVWCKCPACSSFHSTDLQSISPCIKKHDSAGRGFSQPERIFLLLNTKKKEIEGIQGHLLLGGFSHRLLGMYCNSAPLFNADSHSQMSPVDALQASQKLLFSDRCFSGYHPLSHCQHVHLWISFTLLRDFPLQSSGPTEFLKCKIYLYSSAGIYVEWIKLV